MKKVCLVMTMLCALLLACKPEAEKPTVVTASVEDVTETTAKVVGQVTADGGADVTERGVCWNTESNPEITNNRIVEGTGLGTFTAELTDLESNTTYYVRAYATNEKGTSYGEEKNFTTKEIEEPGEPEEPGDDEPEDPENPEEPGDDDDPEVPVVVTVTTYEVTDITINSAVCGGEVAMEGEAVIVARGVCYGTNANPTVADTYTTDGSGVGTYASQITGLTHNTTYYVRAYATDEEGVTSYGEEKTFVTLEMLLPTVTTSEVTSITMVSAVSGGEVTFDGNAAVTSRGVCWSTNQNPTIEDSKTTDGEGVGAFTSNITELSQNTTYYVRAYAVNEMGVAYGEEVSFSTTSTEGTTNGHDWVDLGLPSGLKWATCNVGATAPEQYGDYYSWGEVETKTAYNSNNCSTMYQQIDDFSGDPQYDVARKKWGDAWRMPTKEEQEELLNNCTWELTTINGFSGYKVTGPNGNSIFLPAAGYYYDTYVNFDGYYGGYWSSTPHEDTDSAYYLGFDDKEQRENAYYRSDGQSVRAVIE